MGRERNNGDVHREISWMNPADTSILRLMHSARNERGFALYWRPAIIGKNTGYSKQHAGNRLRELVDRGLVEKEDSWYVISDVAVDLLEGDISPADLED